MISALVVLLLQYLRQLCIIVTRVWGRALWWGIEYDVGEVVEESGEMVGAFAMEDTEDPGDHLELDGFQFTFFRLFRRVEPI